MSVMPSSNITWWALLILLVWCRHQGKGQFVRSIGGRHRRLCDVWLAWDSAFSAVARSWSLKCDQFMLDCPKRFFVTLRYPTIVPVIHCKIAATSSSPHSHHFIISPTNWPRVSTWPMVDSACHFVLILARSTRVLLLIWQDQRIVLLLRVLVSPWQWSYYCTIGVPRCSVSSLCLINCLLSLTTWKRQWLLLLLLLLVVLPQHWHVAIKIRSVLPWIKPCWMNNMSYYYY